MSTGDQGPVGPSGARLAVLTAVVVAVLVAPIAFAVVHQARGGDDPTSGPRRTPAAASTTPSTPSTSSTPSSSPSPTESVSPTASAAPRPRATCWDGAKARTVSACSEPSGERGLAWVFPSIRDQRCGRATDAGPAGLVLRRICHAQVEGGRATIAYAQWDSPAAAAAYLAGQGLRRTGGRRLVFFGGDTRRGPTVAATYADEPFSWVVTLPDGVDPGLGTAQDVGGVATARPPGEVRGATG